MFAIIITFFGLVSPSPSPDTTFRTDVNLAVYASDAGQTPFWQRSLRYGQVPLNNPGAVAIIRHAKTDNYQNKLGWKYEVEATAWGGKSNDVLLTQAYVAGRFKKWELWAGRRKEIIGLGDSSLTSGFYAWSGNATPMPKVQFGTRDYINLLKGWVGLHMTYSHGWFDNQGNTLNAYLHQKTLYGRIGKPNSFINLFGGINHNVSWGGENRIKNGGDYDYYPSDLAAYFYVVTALKDRSIVKINYDLSYDDAFNQFGNHLGSIDLALKLQPKWGQVLLYKQTPYETGRVASLTTFDDGITGISFRLKQKSFIDHIVLENIYTANQGTYISWLGTLLNIPDPHKSEIESYFNNGGRGSFNYQGKGIGTPMIIIDSESQQGGGRSFNYNAVNSWYLGIGGHASNSLLYQFRLSYGTHAQINGPGLKQLSSSIDIQKLLTNKLILQGSLAIDQGDRLPGNVGARIGAKYIIQ